MVYTDNFEWLQEAVEHKPERPMAMEILADEERETLAELDARPRSSTELGHMENPTPIPALERTRERVLENELELDIC